MKLKCSDLCVKSDECEVMGYECRRTTARFIEMASGQINKKMIDLHNEIKVKHVEDVYSQVYELCNVVDYYFPEKTADEIMPLLLETVTNMHKVRELVRVAFNKKKCVCAGKMDS